MNHTRFRRSFIVSAVLVNATANPNTPEIIFASFFLGERDGGRKDDLNHKDLSVTKCTSGTTYVDVKITCITKGSLGRALCGVDAIRPTEKPPENPADSVLSANHNTSYFADFNDVLYFADYTSASTSAFWMLLSDIENYLANPLTAFSSQGRGNSTFERGFELRPKVNITTFERCFALLLNTYWVIR